MIKILSLYDVQNLRFYFLLNYFIIYLLIKFFHTLILDLFNQEGNIWMKNNNFAHSNSWKFNHLSKFMLKVEILILVFQSILLSSNHKTCRPSHSTRLSTTTRVGLSILTKNNYFYHKTYHVSFLHQYRST